VRREGRLRLFLGAGDGELGSPNAEVVFDLCAEFEIGGSVVWILEDFEFAFKVDEAVARAYDGGAMFEPDVMDQVSVSRISSQYQSRNSIAAVNVCSGPRCAYYRRVTVE
jgi:hypothetical protein